jgi:hypothetical protein
VDAGLEKRKKETSDKALNTLQSLDRDSSTEDVGRRSSLFPGGGQMWSLRAAVLGIF